MKVYQCKTEDVYDILKAIKGERYDTTKHSDIVELIEDMKKLDPENV